MLEWAKNDIIEGLKPHWTCDFNNAFNLISAGQGKGNYTTINPSFLTPASYFKGGFKMSFAKTCIQCGTSFVCASSKQKYCSVSCSSKGYQKTVHVSLEQRFWAKVDTSGGPDACWLWTGAKFKSGGYGALSNWPNQPLRANRVSYELHYGPLPEGHFACHNCPGGNDNPVCVNPTHLFAGTHKENMADSKAKGRNKISHAKGEAHYHTDLTQFQVDEMRELYKKGEKPFEIAAKFGIKYQRCYHIIKSYSWKGERNGKEERNGKDQGQGQG